MKEPLWEAFSRLVKKVRQDHQLQGVLIGGGHDFAHALMVAQYCLLIADRPLAILAWVAAVCHNTDRLFPNWNNDQIARELSRYLDNTDFSDDEKNLVVEAVLNHSHRPSPEDNPVTIVLQDADKLGNLGCQVAIRAGQWQPKLPMINLVHLFEYPPGGNYKNPGSICRDISGCLEWEEPGWIRTPKAIELAAPLFEQLRHFNNAILQQFKDTGLFPYPFPEDFE